MVTALYWPESSKIIQKHVEDIEGFGMGLRMESSLNAQAQFLYQKSIVITHSLIPPPVWQSQLVQTPSHGWSYMVREKQHRQFMKLV